MMAGVDVVTGDVEKVGNLFVDGDKALLPVASM